MLRSYCKLASERLTNSLRVGLLRSKVHVARRLKEVTDPTRRDFFDSPRARKHRKEPVTEHSKIMHIDEAKPLSKYQEINEKYEEVQYSSKKYNKDTRESIKYKLEETFEAMAVRELQHPDTILSPEADKRNRINAAEYEKFRLEFYRKNELSRLIKKAQKHQQVGLDGPGYQDNNNFVSELLNKVKVLEEQRQHTGNHPRIEDVRISEMANYQAELKHLKNDRIDGLLGLHNSNPKLKELMEHGFMDRSKPIGEVFELLQEAKQKKVSGVTKHPLLAATASLFGLPQSKEVVLPNVQDQNAAEQTSETGLSAQDAPTSQVSFIQREIQEKYKMLVGDDPNKQSAMEMVLRSMEERGLRGSNQSNYFGLVEFVQDFMEMDQQDKADLLERVSRVRQVREFEERVIRERETFMLEGRGTATFDAIKPEERVQFVKHNVNLYQDVFQLVRSHEQAVKTDPAFAAALVEKLAMGWTLAPLYYKNSDYVDLHMVSKPEYMTLMKQVKNNLPGYGFHEFARIVFGFGRIHSREMGQLTAGLFESLTRKVILVTADHLDRYLEMDRTGLTRDQESAMFYNLGVLLEGLTSLGCVNATAPEQLYHKILAVLGRGINSVGEGCTMNRILAFLLQTRKVMGYSMNKVVSHVAQAAIRHFADSGLHLKLARPEQIDLAQVLIGINNFSSLAEGCRPQLNTLVVALREDIVKNKEKHQLITLADSSTMLVLLQATNQLDIPAKNAIKLKFRDELVLSPTLMSYVVPRTMECLAVAELKDANEFYSEYSRPVELLYMKSLFGIRASEFDRTPRFEVYRDMYSFVTSHADKLDKKELMSVIDALCVIELPVETFNFSLLEKTVEEILEGRNPKQQQVQQKKTPQSSFDTQLSSRMALLYSILGVQNLKNKWLRLTLEAIQCGVKFKPDAALEVILCFDVTSDSDTNESELGMLVALFDQNLDLLVAEVLKYARSMTDSKKVLLAWKLSQLKSVQKEVIDSLLCNLDLTDLKIMDKLLLSQIPGADKVVGTLDEAEISKFYESIFFKSSHLVENDVNSMYWKLVGSLNESQAVFKEKVVLREKDMYHFIPLYLPQKRESLMLYSEDLFLRQLEMSQTRDQGFVYRMAKSDKLPPFFERNEALLQALGLKVERMSSTTAKAKFTIQNSDLELAGYDELSAKKRLNYVGVAPKVAQTEPPKTQNTKTAEKPHSATQKPPKKTSSAEPKRKPTKKQQEQAAQQTPN